MQFLFAKMYSFVQNEEKTMNQAYPHRGTCTPWKFEGGHGPADRPATSHILPQFPAPSCMKLACRDLSKTPSLFSWNCFAPNSWKTKQPAILRSGGQSWNCANLFGFFPNHQVKKGKMVKKWQAMSKPGKKWFELSLDHCTVVCVRCKNSHPSPTHCFHQIHQCSALYGVGSHHPQQIGEICRLTCMKVYCGEDSRSCASKRFRQFSIANVRRWFIGVRAQVDLAFRIVHSPSTKGSNETSRWTSPLQFECEAIYANAAQSLGRETWACFWNLHARGFLISCKINLFVKLEIILFGNIKSLNSTQERWIEVVMHREAVWFRALSFPWVLGICPSNNSVLSWGTRFPRYQKKLPPFTKSWNFSWSPLLCWD